VKILLDTCVWGKTGVWPGAFCGKLCCPSARDASTYTKVRLCTLGLGTPRYPSKIASADKEIKPAHMKPLHTRL
jgi:hypothetical protein